MSPRLPASDNTSASFTRLGFPTGDNVALEYFLPTDEDAKPAPLKKVLYMLYEVGPTMVTIANNCLTCTIDKQ